MISGENTTARGGLRERKKQQTRETISRAALELFAQHGYDDTTLAEIADAAGVAPRTIFAYFESKEDILLCDEHAFLEVLERRLHERPAGTTTVDAIRDFLGAIEQPDATMKLRKQIISSHPELALKLRGRHAELEPLLARSIAQDLGTEPTDLRALLIAASVTAAFTSVRDRFAAAESGGAPITHEQAKATLDQVLEFLRGGLEALTPRDGPEPR